MITKVLEIRDEGTCIAAVAIKMLAATPIEDRFLWREGYPRDGNGVVLMCLSDQRATSDPYEWTAFGWGPRTMPTAHLYIIYNFDNLRDGEVVDVRVILRESTTPADPEIARPE